MPPLPQSRHNLRHHRRHRHAHPGLGPPLPGPHPRHKPTMAKTGPTDEYHPVAQLHKGVMYKENRDTRHTPGQVATKPSTPPMERIPRQLGQLSHVAKAALSGTPPNKSHTNDTSGTSIGPDASPRINTIPHPHAPQWRSAAATTNSSLAYHSPHHHATSTTAIMERTHQNPPTVGTAFPHESKIPHQQTLTAAIATPSQIPILAVSDGSFKSPYGAFSWEIEQDQITLATCTGPVGGSPVTTFRTECYAILTWITFLLEYISYTNTQPSATLTPYSDSEKAIQTTSSDFTKLFQHKPIRPDYDISAALNAQFTILSTIWPQLHPIAHIRAHRKPPFPNRQTHLLHTIDISAKQTRLQTRARFSEPLHLLGVPTGQDGYHYQQGNEHM